MPWLRSPRVPMTPGLRSLSLVTPRATLDTIIAHGTAPVEEVVATGAEPKGFGEKRVTGADGARASRHPS